MKYFVCGGAGFIGSNLVKILLNQDQNAKIIVYDNFTSGRKWHLSEVIDNDRLKIIEGDIKDKILLNESIKGSDIVYHFASNPDIARAVREPDIDFWEGTYLTNNVLEAMRVNNVKNILYASGSGVYGDVGEIETAEDFSPKLPISTYGASKLSCEMLMSAYSYMFDINAAAFRFANVVGPNQTHGVVYDFIRKLSNNSSCLNILGDGTQSKSYIYVYDVINAMRIVEKNYLNRFSYYNVATKDYITVKEIADTVIKVMNFDNVSYNFSGGDRGWKGDVPKVRINSEKIRTLNWDNQYTCKEAILKSATILYKQFIDHRVEKEK